MSDALDMKAVKAQFDQDGFAELRGFLSADEVETLLGEFKRFQEQIVPHIPNEKLYYEDKSNLDTLKQVQKIQEYDAYFARMLSSERFVNIARTLLGDHVVLSNVQWLTKHAKIGTPTPPHQDGYYFMLDPDEAITLWLALDVVDETNGCVRYVPGSHLQGRRDHHRTEQLGFSQGIEYSDEDMKTEVALHAQPGDLLAHHSMTVHRADANISDRPRRAIGFTYFALRCKEDVARKEAYQAVLDRDMAEAGKL